MYFWICASEIKLAPGVVITSLWRERARAQPLDHVAPAGESGVRTLESIAVDPGPPWTIRRASQSAVAHPWARSSQQISPHRWSASPPHPSSTSSQVHWSRPSRLLTSTAGQLAGAEAVAARDPRCHHSPSPEHLPTPGTTKIEPQTSLHHSPALSRPSSASSSPDSGHLHPCPWSGPHCEVWGLSRGWNAKPRELFVRNQFLDLGCRGWTCEKSLKIIEKSENCKSNFVGFLVKKPIFSRKHI
jgi:hypothetical protein